MACLEILVPALRGLRQVGQALGHGLVGVEAVVQEFDYVSMVLLTWYEKVVVGAVRGHGLEAQVEVRVEHGLLGEG